MSPHPSRSDGWGRRPAARPRAPRRRSTGEEDARRRPSRRPSSSCVRGPITTRRYSLSDLLSIRWHPPSDVPNRGSGKSSATPPPPVPSSPTFPIPSKSTRRRGAGGSRGMLRPASVPGVRERAEEAQRSTGSTRRTSSGTARRRCRAPSQSGPAGSHGRMSGRTSFVRVNLKTVRTDFVQSKRV